MKIKNTFLILGILQLIIAIPFDGTNLMPIFGFLSILWSALAVFLPPIYPEFN